MSLCCVQFCNHNAMKEGQVQRSKLHIKLGIGHKETEKRKELKNYMKN